MALAGLLASSFLADLLLLSAGYKAFKFHDYSAAVTRFSLFTGFNAKLLRVILTAIPALEVGVAVLLLAPSTNPVGLVSATALFLAFLAVVVVDKRPEIAHCGCWGVVSLDIPKSAYLARNLILVAVAAAGNVVRTLGEMSAEWGLPELIMGLALMLPLALVGLQLPEIVHLTAFERAARRET